MKKNRPLKIGIVCYPTYGGSGVVAAELGKHLIKMGHEIHFFSYSLPIRLNSYENKIFFHEVTWIDYPLFEQSPYSLALSAKLVEVSTYYKLDLIHVHYALPHSISAILARDMVKKKKLKIVTTLHGTDVTLVGIDESFYPITKYGIEQSDAVTCVSKFLADLTIEKFFLRKKPHVIPNFVDTNEFVPGKRRHHCPILADSRYNIIHISNFRPIKRVVDVIKAFEIIQKDIDACLLMVGDGSERSQAERYALDHNILSKVHFLGKQINIIELLQSSDILLLPSELESFGLVALEAMSCETPVVSTNVGGLPEVIVHDETGYLTKVGDIKNMAEYCLKILTNPSLKTTLGKNARLRAQNLFDTNKVVPLYEQLYKQILS
ncbi:MAG: N-acetyl-alpha-D-glucosaminyl L-malate synthase BshA [Candidatus Fischerbacteria bacterium RBG_13_37_8]|uniref:N-acetyl-alpha-D-glucosaminyl L-malate synthase BshA n=1 Tax=Candidatus Fischerbacteria bacterium RBG_13_37_8 TaxID=1817863 RepID=A0A1F5VML8_9BACT|nr:MAG: N-acetyl-alpha-D-glucosaminyl L-malate synthase BshA [Candidatus Fischerbacteria bacterium RBG_13_37_8]